ncbi:MAG: hypothetical protein MI924_04495 [Chloroflexales bacterium]|nr:hypothetical protein [Chloroflexales bacterium]
MTVDSPARSSAQSSAWLLANIAGGALALGWLGTPLAPVTENGMLSLTAFLLLPLILPSLAWSILQWLVLRQARSGMTAWWMVAVWIGWLLNMPLINGIQSFPNLSFQNALGIARDIEIVGPIGVQIVAAYLFIVAALTFFTFLASMLLILPQCLVLLARSQTRSLAQAWFGRGVFGWTIGVVGGGAIVSLCTIVSTGVFGAGMVLPAWLALGLIGGSAGGCYAWYLQDLIQNYQGEILAPV